MKAHKNNFCGGSFEEWLAVNLLSECNAKCKFCIERNEGHKFKEKLEWNELAKIIVKTDKKRVMLLGGEPTLYKNLKELINYIKNNSNKEIFLTTNGYLLNEKFVKENLYNLTGISISICDYDMVRNSKIYGLKINKSNLKSAINEFKKFNINTRLNCNIIPGHIDNEKEIYEMIKFCKDIGIDEFRISELFSNTQHIKLDEIFHNKFGLNDEPFAKGCLHKTVIDGVNVVFRQCCGLETTNRNSPDNPEIDLCNKVLYYNGKIYSGWVKNDTDKMNPIIVKELIETIIENNGGKI